MFPHMEPVNWFAVQIVIGFYMRTTLALNGLNIVNKYFASNLLSHGQHWAGLSMEQRKKNKFVGCLMKVPISVLSFNAESAKKVT